MAALRALFQKAKPSAWGWRNRLVKGKLAVLGAVGCSDSSSPIVVGLLKNHRLLPASFNLQCRHCFLQPTPSPPSPVKFATDFNYKFNAISCANDDKGALCAADYTLDLYNECKDRSIQFLQVARASAIRFALSIYSLTFEGIDENDRLTVCRAVVLHDPLQKMKKVIDWQLVNESFPSPPRETRRLDSAENSLGIIDFCTQWESKNDLHSPPTVASDAIVPVDIADNEQIYNYALSAVKIHNKNSYMDEKVCLKKVLCARKSEVDSGVIYFLLLSATDFNEDCNTYCSIFKVLKEENWRVVNKFFSEPLKKYQIGLSA